jgi:hypothetical protein
MVAGVAAALALYPRMNEEICRRVEAKLSGHYRGLKVTVRSAEVVEGKGIRIHDLSIVEQGAEGPRAELLHVDEALLECSTDWKELVQGEPAVHRVIVRRPTLRATHRPDGSWSAGQLFPPPQFGDQPPEVKIEGGLIEVLDPLKAPASTMVLRDVHLSLVPSVGPAPSEAEMAGTGSGRARLDGAPGSGQGSRTRRLRGMFAGDGFRRVEVEGWVNMQRPSCSIRGQAEAVEISPELLDSLPSPLVAKLPALGLRGQGDLRFEVGYDRAAATPLRYRLSGRLVRGRIDDARLPHPLTELRTAARLDNDGYSIDDFAARCGQGSVRLSCRQTGFKPESPLQVTAELRQLDLDRALLGILPRSLQEQWYKYRPAGEVDADVQLAFDGRKWQPEVAVRCLNVSFTHHKFPYRLDHGKGTVGLTNDRLQMNLTAYSGGEPVRLTGESVHPFSEPTGWFEAKGDGIPLDESLLAALPEKSSEVVRALQPRGTVNFYLRMWRDKPQDRLHEHLVVAANQCSIRYEKFPYPLSGIRGTLEMFDGAWTFRNLEGNNDKARVTCEGRLTPGFQGNELVLNLVGHDVALNEDLRGALSPHLQQVWHDLRPRGEVDLSAEVHFLSDTKKTSVTVRARPQAENASIEPIYFPYRLDHLQGEWLYRDGHVAFERCKAEHGAVKITTDGFCHFSTDGRWKIHFADLTADRLHAERDLIQALPERLRKAVLAINPTGSVNLRGNVDFERTGQPGALPRSQWDIRLGLQQSNLQVGGILLENVHGEATLRGGFDGERLRTRGELALDSLSYKDCQLTEVRGPIWIDDGRVLMGTWVDRQQGDAETLLLVGSPQAPRRVTANFCGGNFFADGWATLEAEPRYAVNATLTEADLGRCALELAPDRRNLSGKVLATADLMGSGRTRNALTGRGMVRLSEGNVYELPLMISLLKILSIRPPDQNAFSDATINYRVEGEHVYFDRIDFHGDAISLRGKGELNFQSQIALTFYATVGRGELDLPIIKQVFSGASQQMMLIHVGGTLQNPETRREALPLVNHALQQLTGEAQNRK